MCAIKKSGGVCDTCLVPWRRGSCDELWGPAGTEGELESLSMYRLSSPELEEDLTGEGSGFTHAQLAVSPDCGCEEDCAIVKRARVCISQTSSGTVGASTSGVRG